MKKIKVTKINLAFLTLMMALCSSVKVEAKEVFLNDYVLYLDEGIGSGEEIEDYEDLESYCDSCYETLNRDLNNYSGMALDPELEDYIKEKCYEAVEMEEYNLEITGEDLFRIMMTIGYKESNGTWACDGVISATNDYGQFQINRCNHKTIYENLGYTSDDLLNDRYKNTDAAIYLICNNILSHKKCQTIEDVFGMYNGWTNWKNIKRSVRYKNNCLKIMEEYFGTKEYVKKLEK